SRKSWRHHRDSNSSTSFTVTFTPTAAGARAAAIHIASNDADENPFDISLTGTGSALGGALALGAAGFTVNETAGTIVIPITRSGSTTGDVSVKVTTTNGTAVAPGDFGALTNSVVTILDGQSSGSATINIVDTTTLPGEANETFTVTLSGAT